MVAYIVYVGVGVAAVAACGAWLRWACRPVIIAYAVGMRVERIKQRQRAVGQHRATLLQPTR